MKMYKTDEASEELDLVGQSQFSQSGLNIEVFRHAEYGGRIMGNRPEP